MPSGQSITYYLFAAAFTVLNLGAFAQSDTTSSSLMLGNIYTLLREDTLLNSTPGQSSVSSHHNEDIRETPGAIMVISAEQIKAMGATDLMDVLYSIPGIGLGRDVDDAIGIGMRGLWAHEGKVQFLYNGIPLNDLDFGTLALGNRIMVENISRIEILNGPGSVIYGGVAALGVINIITRSPLENSGTRVTAETAVSNGYSSSNMLNLTSNHQIGTDTYISTHIGLKSSLRSTWEEQLADGSNFSYGDSTRIHNQSLFLGLTKRNYKSQFYLNNYSYDVSDAQYGIMMFSLGWDNQWKKQISKKTTLLARSIYQYQLPWFNLNTSDPDLTSTNTIAQRLTGSLIIDHSFNSHLTWTGGIQAYRQHGQIVAREQNYYINGENQISLSDLACYGEFNWQGKAGVFKLGGRIEKNTFSKLLYSPRFAYNKILGKTYVKVLVSNAFKIPTLQNINLGPEEETLMHESVMTGEFTIGRSINKNGHAEIAVFRTSINNPIVYATDTLNLDNYLNRNITGTSGIEGRITVQGDRVFLFSGFCLYKVNDNTDIPEIEIEGNSTFAYLGLPRFRMTSQLAYHMTPDVTMTCSGVMQGRNFSYEYEPVNPEETVLTESPRVTTFNIGMQIHPARIKSLRFNVGVNNIFNSRINITSPSITGPSRMPVNARTAFISLTYRMNS